MKNLSKGFRSSGFSLVETLVAMGILGIISLSSGRLIESQLRSQRRIEIANSRDSIAKLVQANLANSAAISNSKSKTENSHYVKCKTGLIIDAVTGALDPAGCVALVSATPKEHDFSLYTPLGTTAISGSLSAPLYYDARGNVCPGAAANCPLEVKTWFVTACPAGATSCAKGTDIEYRYSVSSIDPRISIRPITGIWTETDITAQSATGPGAPSCVLSGATLICCTTVGTVTKCAYPSTGEQYGVDTDYTLPAPALVWSSGNGSGLSIGSCPGTQPSNGFCPQTAANISQPFEGQPCSLPRGSTCNCKVNSNGGLPGSFDYTVIFVCNNN